MIKVRVHIFILGKRPDEIVAPGDKHYEAFKSWAEKGDRSGGAVICSFHEEPPVKPVDDAGETVVGEVDTDIPLSEISAEDGNPVSDEPVAVEKPRKKGK